MATMRRGNHIRAIWPAMLLVAPAAHAAASVTLYCPFEGSARPQIHAGDPAPALEGEEEYVEGIRGRGLVVGDGGAHVEYAAAGNFDLRESTVSFWVKPLDWEGTDDKFHVFFQCSAPAGGDSKGSRLLYKYLVPGRFLMLAIPDGEIPYVNYQGAAYADIASWKPGEWHHVAGCWRAAGMTLYLDGQPIGGRVYANMPMDLGETIQFGDSPWHVEREARTVADELTIYDRALNATEVELLYGRPKVESLSVALEPHFLKGYVTAHVDAWDLQDDAQVSVELAADGGPAAATQVATRVPPGADLVAVEVPLKGVGPGTYRIVASAEGNSAEAELVIPEQPPWLGTRVGVSEDVPPPWTPMREQNGTIECWNRSHEIAPGPLPQQIVSGSASVLAGPVEIEVEAQGNAVPWRDVSFTITRRTATEVSFRGEASGGKLRLAVEGRVEFDGLCWFDVSLSGPPGSSVDAIALNVPMRGEVARFYQGVFDDPNVPAAGEVPEGEGVLLEQPFTPVLWVGNDDRGLQWLAETSEPWDDPERPGSLRLVREGDAALLRVEPVRSRLALDQPWEFSFGLQASPIRPVDPEWRRGRLSGMPGTVHMIWANQEDMIWFGYPKARDPEALRAKVAGFQKPGARVIPYSTPFVLSIDSPESRLYGHEWLRVGEGDSGSADVVRMGGCAQYTCPSAPDYADFTTWAHERFVDEVGFDGLYFDISGLRPMDFEAGGTGYRREGRLIPTYPILAKREIMKRMYVMLKQRQPEGFLMIHCSGQAVLPFMGFADIRAMGEDLSMRLSNTPDYRTVVSEAGWRAIQSGHAYGFSNVLLPMLKGHEDDPVPMEQAMGLVLLYGMDIWPGYGHKASQSAMRKACDQFGLVGAEYVPFWEEDLPIQASEARARVSLYRQPDRTMVVVTNESYQAIHTTLTVDHDALGLPAGAPWTDLLADEPVDPDAPREIGPGGYCLIRIGG